MKEFLQAISGKRVLVVGDVMLDRYWWGSVNRISPEAPVPVVSLERETLVLGGAANVASNIAGLGAVPTLVGLIGDDAAGKSLLEQAAASGIDSSSMFVTDDRPTTVKTRVIAHHQQIVRLDEEKACDVGAGTETKLLDSALAKLESSDAVLLSDYAKGCLTPALTAGIIAAAGRLGKPVVIDPKGKDYSKYRGAYLLTPNHKETMEACGLAGSSAHELETAGRRMVQDLGLHAMLVTRGEHGMMLLETERDTFELKASARDVYDVTGAGDTVIATLTAAVAAGLSLRDAATAANKAAGIVVEHVGTTAITRELLLRDN